MAVTLTPLAISRSGAYPVYSTGATGGFEFANTGKEFLLIKASGATGGHFHAHITETVDAQTPPAKMARMTAGYEMTFGPFATDHYGTTVTITTDFQTGMLVAALQLTKLT